jgi:hypothetical protein
MLECALSAVRRHTLPHLPNRITRIDTCTTCLLLTSVVTLRTWYAGCDQTQKSSSMTESWDGIILSNAPSVAKLR